MHAWIIRGANGAVLKSFVSTSAMCMLEFGYGSISNTKMRPMDSCEFPIVSSERLPGLPVHIPHDRPRVCLNKGTSGLFSGGNGLGCSDCNLLSPSSKRVAGKVPPEHVGRR